MSASASNCLRIARPSGCLRFSVSDFLLRACTNHHSEVPSYSLRHLRSGSPPSGDSTLITSAPNSAQMREANGPAIRVPSSMTFRPASGLALNDMGTFYTQHSGVMPFNIAERRRDKDDAAQDSLNSLAIG